jgi:hypothetical protein
MEACLKCEVHEEADGLWSVVRDGRVLRSDFQSESSAALAAIDLARDAGRSGYNATVEIYGAFGEAPLSWTYGDWPDGP